MFVPIPTVPWFPGALLLMIVIFIKARRETRHRRALSNAKIKEVDYSKLSEKKLRYARWRYSDCRGFIYLGTVSRLGSRVVELLGGEEAVCRVEGNELRLYLLDRPGDYFWKRNGFEPTRTDVAFRVEGKINISAKYWSNEAWGTVSIEFSDADGKYEYTVRGWTKRGAKENVTCALVQLYEAMSGRL